MINITVTSIYTPLPFSVYYDRLSICIPYLQGFKRMMVGLIFTEEESIEIEREK